MKNRNLYQVTVFWVLNSLIATPTLAGRGTPQIHYDPQQNTHRALSLPCLTSEDTPVPLMILIENHLNEILTRTDHLPEINLAFTPELAKQLRKNTQTWLAQLNSSCDLERVYSEVFQISQLEDTPTVAYYLQKLTYQTATSRILQQKAKYNQIKLNLDDVLGQLKYKFEISPEAIYQLTLQIQVWFGRLTLDSDLTLPLRTLSQASQETDPKHQFNLVQSLLPAQDFSLISPFEDSPRQDQTQSPVDFDEIERRLFEDFDTESFAPPSDEEAEVVHTAPSKKRKRSRIDENIRNEISQVCSDTSLHSGSLKPSKADLNLLRKVCKRTLKRFQMAKVEKTRPDWTVLKTLFERFYHFDSDQLEEIQNPLEKLAKFRSKQVVFFVQDLREFAPSRTNLKYGSQGSVSTRTLINRFDKLINFMLTEMGE